MTREFPALNILWVVALVGAVVGTSILRVFHTEPSAFGAFGSALFLLVVVLGIGHLRHRTTQADLFSVLDRPYRLTFALCAPFLLAVALEKWVSTSLLLGRYEWIDATFHDGQLADSVYRLWTGLTLLAVSLGLVFVLRQSMGRLTHMARPRRLVFAFVATACGVLAAALVLGLAAWSTGSLRFGVANLSQRALGFSIVAQIVRGIVEELYYRGLLQVALARLLVRAGLPYGRMPRIFAILTISIGFALEHVDPQLGPVESARSLLFVFFMSVALGVLFETSRNLYLVMIAHAVINLLIAHVIPMPVTDQLVPLLPSQVIVMVFLIVLFAAVVASHRLRGQGLRTASK